MRFREDVRSYTAERGPGSIYRTAIAFWSELADEYSKQSVAVDMYCCTRTYVDVASIGKIFFFFFFFFFILFFFFF